MIDNVMVNIGAAFMIVGGVALVAIVLSLVIYAAGWAWVAASDKWRDILRAESLIYEYRMNREYYIEWRENANKTRDNAVPVVHCKDCKHYHNHPNGMCYLHTEPKETERGYSGEAVCVEPDDFCSYGERKDGGAE